MKIQHGSAVRTARLLGLAVTPLMLAAIHTDAHAMSSMARQSLQSDVADTATDVVNAFHAALKRGDATAALNLMAEDVVIFESGGVERHRAEYATHHLKSDAAFSAATTRVRPRHHPTSLSPTLNAQTLVEPRPTTASSPAI